MPASRQNKSDAETKPRQMGLATFAQICCISPRGACVSFSKVRGPSQRIMLSFCVTRWTNLNNLTVQKLRNEEIRNQWEVSCDYEFPYILPEPKLRNKCIRTMRKKDLKPDPISKVERERVRQSLVVAGSSRKWLIRNQNL